jgi:lysophospholipase L1-like esterase
MAHTAKTLLPILRSLRVIILFFLGFLLAVNSVEASKRKQKKKRKSSVSKFRPVVSRLENADSPEFRQLLNRWKDLKKGKKAGNTSVLILGDSHNQCEDFGIAFSRYLSDSLQIPSAGRSFVFPYPLARTSHRSDMVFGPGRDWHGCRFTKTENQCEWGLSGWTAHFNLDSTSFFWKISRGSFQKGDEFILLSPEKSAGQFQVWMKDSTGTKTEMLYNRKEVGYSAFLSGMSNEVEFILKKRFSEAEFVLQGIVRKPVDEGVSIGISGTNGARLDHYLQNPDFQRHLKVINPALIIIALGTNDAFSGNFNPETTRQALQELLTKIKSATPDAAIVLIGPPDHCVRKRIVNPKTAKVNAVFSEIAEALDFVFWNQQKSMGGKGAILAWRSKGLATKDLVHFTPDGYSLQARLFGRALRLEF